MTRIIAGLARGRRLQVPAGDTRPTSDRVRESLFSSLESAVDLEGAQVLDLYAGSGALGLEALSRGAERVVLVDKSAPASRAMSANIATVGLPGATVERADVQTFLQAGPQPFDVVFLDPPYRLSSRIVEQVLDTLTQGWLGPQAVVVVERGRGGDDLTWPQGFGQGLNRRLGDTHVLRAVWYGHEQIQDLP